MTATASWPLWSTEATLVVTDPTALAPARMLLDGYLAAVEDAASRFRPDSEVSRLPRRGRHTVLVSPVLADLLAQALWAARTTDGLVDPTVGGALCALGYDDDLALVVRRAGRPALRAVARGGAGPAWPEGRGVPGHRRLGLRGRVLTLDAGPDEDLVLDLGATAKAVAADRCAAAVHRSLGTGVLVSLGGDVATAGPPPDGGWQVVVDDGGVAPRTQVTLPRGWAVATSSVRHRRWRDRGREHHHLLDPRTGRPADTWWTSVTVAESTCLHANALATAALVRGPGGPAWLRARGATARLVGPEGSVLTVGGWPEEVAA